MTDYQPLSTISARLQASEGDLYQLRDRNWIALVEKNGNTYISGRDAYKARFILHLRRLLVTEDEIAMVLETFQPPYSLAEVGKTLARPLRA